MKQKTIGLVLKGYPRLSETFIAQEILELERAGFHMELISLRHPTDNKTHPIHDEINARVHYLPEYLHQEPMRVFRAFVACISILGFIKAASVFVRDLRRDFTRNRVRRFGQALVMAAETRGDFALHYAHFLHTPCSVARYAGLINQVPLAISAHAKDIWTSPDWEIREKIDTADWLVTCTRFGANHLKKVASEPHKVNLVYHGLDLARFPTHSRDALAQEGPLKLISVGRAVSKKGLDTALHALAKLPKTIDWQWTHIGGGPLRDNLIQQARDLGIEGKCQFLGSLPQTKVLEAYRSSHMFILPCRVDETGDRDGLPNVIVEAQSQALPVISTHVSGVPELIENGVNGLLVEPDDVAALTHAIQELAGDGVKRNQMGKAGEERVRSKFSHEANIPVLVTLLKASLDRQK